MNRREREIEDAAVSAGVRVVLIVRGDHYKVRLRAGDGREMTYHTGGTPSDRRGHARMVSDFRKFARGVLGSPRVVVR